jgi:hypothetical protein
VTDYPDQITSTEQNLAVLKARTLTRYSEHKARVEELPSSTHRQALPDTLTLLASDQGWEIYTGVMESGHTDSSESAGRLIYECARAARAAAWLAHNQLAGPGLKLRIRPRPGPVALETMMEILERIAALFPPIDFKARAEQTAGDMARSAQGCC